MSDHDRADELADDPADISPSGWKDVALRVKDEFKTDHVTLSASGVAFQAFLSLIPLLVAAVSLYGLVADPANVTRLVDRLSGTVPDAVTELIRTQLDSIVTASSGALGVGVVVGVATALWTASSGVRYLMEGLNIAYDEDPDSRPFWRRRGLALLLTLLVLAFLALAATIVTVATTRTGMTGVVTAIVGWMAVAILLGVVLAVFYRYGPDRADPEWVWVSPGSIFTVSSGSTHQCCSVSMSATSGPTTKPTEPSAPSSSSWSGRSSRRRSSSSAPRSTLNSNEKHTRTPPPDPTSPSANAAPTPPTPSPTTQATTSDDTETAVLASATAYATFALDEPAAFSVMDRLEYTRVDDPALWAARERGFFALHELIEAHQSTGWAAHRSPLDLLATTWSFVHGFVELWTGGPLWAPYDGNDLTDVLTDLLDPTSRRTRQTLTTPHNTELAGNRPV